MTIYRPKSGSPKSQSTTVAKCNGINQVEEGSFKIYRGEEVLTDEKKAEKRAAGDDVDSPVISDVNVYKIEKGGVEELLSATKSKYTLSMKEVVRVKAKITDDIGLDEDKVLFTVDSDELKGITKEDDIYYMDFTLKEKSSPYNFKITISAEDKEGNEAEEETVDIIVDLV